MRAILLATAINCALGMICSAMPKDPEQTPDEEFATVKEALIRTRAALQQFSWNMHTEVSLRGQVKKISDDICRYGPDGTVYKTSLVTPPPEPERRSLRKRAAVVKTDEVDDSLVAALALADEYVPPVPQKLEALFQAANALFVKRADSDETQLQFRDYLKTGDFLVLSFDPGTKSLGSIDVTSYLDEKADVVTLHVLFKTLPDGTNYVASSVLNAAGRQIQVKTENANYRKVWQ